MSKQCPVKTPVTLLAWAVCAALYWPAANAQTTADTTARPTDAQTPATAEAARADSVTLDAVTVTGMRATQQNSSLVKREATVIVDAVVNDEIGALPDNSVGETLERVAGVTADRFKGSASEISIRGLGPFLGFSTLNGREVSSGSGDRAVSFQQFPSELTNGVLVYKTQQADFVEGGISGVIELRTARPLDYGKQRIQIEGRANYLPYADKAGADPGSRLSASYIDQFDTGLGKVGVALGLAATDSTAPEDFYTASSAYRPCNTINTTPSSVTSAAAGNCSYAAGSGNPAYFVPNQFNFRQLDTQDKRSAFVGAVQWRPNDRWDVNFDLQLSKRESFEDRHDLVIAEGRRGIAPSEVSADGALLRYTGNSFLENIATVRNREERYGGGGLSASFKATDALTLSGDLSYSRTHRNQLDLSSRLRSNTLFGPSGRVAYTFDQASSDIPIIGFLNPIDLNNHDAYTGNAFARRIEEDRVDEIRAARFDMSYDRYGVWNQIKAGVRLSDHDRVTDLENENNLESIPTANTLAGNANCRTGNLVRDWGEDSDTNLRSWAQFDTRCLYRAFTGTDDRGAPADTRSAGDLDINERIRAAYVMGSFSTELAGHALTGNVGVRFVDNKITSKGYRGAYRLVTTRDPITGVASYRLDPVAGSFDPIELEHSYNNVLPSFNANLELRENLFLRGGLYKAIARSNIEDLGAGRVLITDGSAATPEEALAGASGGNPRLEPLEAWNADLSLEYYPNPDTSYSLALFYKRLKAASVPANRGSLNETFVIDGVSYTVPVAQQTNSSAASYLRGFEVGANHAFTSLPAPFDGLGVQLNYSYADSDFKYDDPSATEPTLPLADFTDPVGIPGLSKHTGSATVYYERGGLSLRLIYKYRSDYFKPSGLTALRVADDAGYLDLSASYDLNAHVQLKFQAINIGNEHQVMYRPVDGSIAESSYFGTSYFLGVRFKY
ncbi:TonB-dependent receptor [Lysobacter sp. CA199]|uniref:TonB-dependent receptor n=1 Tax=Lysobacter sp. CA199 TaxID=3455608 RepID=UPI003F8D5500